MDHVFNAMTRIGIETPENTDFMLALNSVTVCGDGRNPYTFMNSFDKTL